MPAQNRPDWVISVSELKNELGSVKLVDVRQPEEFIENRIDGATLIPLGELDSRAEQELKKDESIVVYCAKGMRSLEAVLLLRQKGFKNSRTLEGGIYAWIQA